MTAEWYNRYLKKENVEKITLNQINNYKIKLEKNK